MKKTRAFTLIEVMVVLSILAIIAILAYNFFGSTMKDAVTKQAATKIIKDLNLVAAAGEKFEMAFAEGKLAAWQPLTISSVAGTATGTETSFMGPELQPILGLREFPHPPESGKDPGWDANCWGGDLNDYYYFGEWDDYSNDGNTDLAILTDGVSKEVCEAINQISNGTTTIPDVTGADYTGVTVPAMGCYYYDCTGYPSYFALMPFRLYGQFQ